MQFYFILMLFCLEIICCYINLQIYIYIEDKNHLRDAKIEIDPLEKETWVHLYVNIFVHLISLCKLNLFLNVAFKQQMNCAF